MLESLDYWAGILFKQKIGELISLMNSAVPNFFWHQEPILWKRIFPRARVERGWFGMIQEHYIYWALYF